MTENRPRIGYEQALAYVDAEVQDLGHGSIGDGKAGMYPFGLSSIDRLDLIMRVEKGTGLKIPCGDASKFTTFEDLARYVSEHSGATEAGE